MALFLWEDPDVITATGPSNGAGYYTYTGAASVFASGNTQIQYSGGLQDGFTYAGEDPYLLDQVQFAFYHTRGTTTPIPGNNNAYKVLEQPSEWEQVKLTALVLCHTCRLPFLSKDKQQEWISQSLQNWVSTSKEATEAAVASLGTSGTTDVNDAFYVCSRRSTNGQRKLFGNFKADFKKDVTKFGVKPIMGEFGGSSDSIYASNVQSVWARWRRGELQCALHRHAAGVSFTYILPQSLALRSQGQRQPLAVRLLGSRLLIKNWACIGQAA